MIYRSVTILIAVALLLTPMSVGAKVGEFTGDNYFKECTTTDPNWKPKNSEEQDKAVYCIGYIDAAVTFLVMMNGLSYCLPTNSTPQDILKATIAFMQAHPEQTQYLFGSVMMAAVQNQWPCGSK
jgi:hypothetical protein